MSESDKADDSNLFKMIDGVIRQVDRTKKLFIVMILSIMVVPPIVFAITFLLLDPPLQDVIQGRPVRDPAFIWARIIPFAISVIWLGIGIWQWFALSKWTKRFKHYKESEKKLDRELDSNSGDGTS